MPVVSASFFVPDQLDYYDNYESLLLRRRREAAKKKKRVGSIKKKDDHVFFVSLWKFLFGNTLFWAREFSAKTSNVPTDCGFWRKIIRKPIPIMFGTSEADKLFIRAHGMIISIFQIY